MNILLLEDRGSCAYHVERQCEDDGHLVYCAFNLNDAQSYWDDRTRNAIDCIVIDLQVDTEGLTEAQKSDAEGGTLAGWVWLREKVLRDAPKMRPRIVIYSGFVDVFNQKVVEAQRRGIRVISKLQPGAAESLVAGIREIARLAGATR